MTMYLNSNPRKCGRNDQMAEFFRSSTKDAVLLCPSRRSAFVALKLYRKLLPEKTVKRKAFVSTKYDYFNLIPYRHVTYGLEIKELER